MATCRFCAEEIKDAAIVCKHCGRELSSEQDSAVPANPPAPNEPVKKPRLGLVSKTELLGGVTGGQIRRRPVGFAFLIAACLSGFIGDEASRTVFPLLLAPIGALIITKGNLFARISGCFILSVIFMAWNVGDPARNLPPNFRLISQADYGEDWPFTVEEGVLSCQPGPVYNNEPLPEVVFTTDGTTYGMNGVALGSGNYAEDEAIRRQAPLVEPVEPLTTVPEAERRELFADEIACERSATEEAERRFPINYASQAPDFEPQIEENIEEDRRLAGLCKGSLRESAGLTEDEFAQISTEGVLLGWPPLTPTRMSVSQIILDGIALCEEP